MSTELDPTRKAHRVTRKQIERDGTDAPRLLYWAFDHFNAVFFGSALKAPLIWIAPTSSPRAAGTYTPRDVHGLESIIRIAPATFKRGLRAALAVLLHEMVHAWQHEVLEDTEPGNKGHGPRFCTMANEIAGALELPVELWVSVRGREKGTRRPEHWPELPRFEDDPLPPRKPAAKGAGDVEQGEVADPDGAAPEVLDRQALICAAAAAERARIVRMLGDRALYLRSHKKATSAAALNAAAKDIQDGVDAPTDG